MKKQALLLLGALCLALPLTAAAEETAPAPSADAAQTAPAIDPSLTNQKTPYPAPAEAVPAAPIPPAGGVSDVQGFLAYGQQLDAYIKALQAYIDGATNDANAIIEKRNEAVKAANDAVAQYNSFIEKNANQ